MSKSLTIWGPLAGALLILLLWPLVHALSGVPPTELELAVLSYVPGVFVLLWIAADAASRRCTPCFDFGFLMLMLFPLTLLGYLVWTRGWLGMAVFAGMIAVIYGAWFVGITVALAAAG